MSDTKTENKEGNGAEHTESAPETPPEENEGATTEDASADANEDVAPDEASEEQEAPPPEPTLEERLEQSKNATKAMKEKMLRVAADFENFRRRSNKEIDDARKRGKQTAVKDLLPVFDNLERATAHVDETTDAKSMADGLRMVHKQFIDVLGKMGIERVASVGQGFDPNVHESIQYDHSDDFDAGIVMNELQPGYKDGAMLIRPAMVMVSRGPAPAEEPTAEDEPTAENAEDEASDEAGSPSDAAEPDETATADPPEASDASADSAEQRDGDDRAANSPQDAETDDSDGSDST